MRHALATLALSLAACAPPPLEVDDPTAFAALADDGVRLVTVVGGLRFLEGPVWVPARVDGALDTAGELVFSDLRADRVYRWSAERGLGVLREAREPNGNALDGSGRLLTCEHGARRIARSVMDDTSGMDDASGEVTTLVDSFEGARLHSPNDLVLGAGALWFTDPRYGLHGEPFELDFDGVFRLDLATGELRVAARDFDRPNGIALSPDGRTLFVSDSGAPDHVRAFDVGADGQLANDRVVYALGAQSPDGMCTDADGRLYVTAEDGVHVLVAPEPGSAPSIDGTGTPRSSDASPPAWRRIALFRTPRPARNVCFGGPEGRTLFVTAGGLVLAAELRTRGAAPPPASFALDSAAR